MNETQDGFLESLMEYGYSVSLLLRAMGMLKKNGAVHGLARRQDDRMPRHF
jgi:hypothetical protein